MSYWKKLHKEEAGFYFAESDFTTDTLHIFKINPNMWGYAFNKGMTRGTFRTLADAKKHFGI